MPSTSLCSLPFAVIDLETTGASARDDRVTEVAVVRVEHGQPELVFEALLDPERPIPAFITRLTGISPQMVQGLPVLGNVLPELERALAGAIVVAHNAPFDASFLRASFERAGRPLRQRWLCTLRLARRLLPTRRGYRLAALAADLALPVVPAHRARADAEATAHLLLRLLHQAEAQQLGLSALFAVAGLSAWRRRGVDEAVLKGLPEGPGVYLLRDAAGEVLYVGESAHVRRRVREHAREASAGQRGATEQPRLQRVLPAVRDVESVSTPTELEALLLESRLIKRYQPPGNVQQRGERDLPFVRIDLDEPFPRLEATRQGPDGRAVYFGPYRRAEEVAEAVELLQGELGLRACSRPVRPGQRSCYLVHVGKCLGPCLDEVDAGAYRRAAARAIECLAGRDRAVLHRLAARRDALAQQLRFEEAAQLRDRLRALERLVGNGHAPRQVDQRNLVAVSPGQVPGERHLFFVRAGRLAHQLACPPPPGPDQLATLLQHTYAGHQGERLSRREVDEMRVLERWLACRRKRLHVVQVAADQPLEALPRLLQAMMNEERDTSGSIVPT